VPSTVFIVTPLKEGHTEGSGTLIDVEKRLVLTCFHLVDGSDTVFVQFPVRLKDGELETDKNKYMDRVKAGQAIKGKVLHVDKTRDLAIVQLEKVPAGTPALPLARTSPRVGEQLLMIGTFNRVESTFSTIEGKVSGVKVLDLVVGGGNEALRIKAKMVQVTNPIGPSSSGGPRIDRRGYLVAVEESGYSGAAAQNVNCCIDVTEVRAFLKDNKVTIKDLADEKAGLTPKR
jgi:serine protease Do